MLKHNFELKTTKFNRNQNSFLQSFYLEHLNDEVKTKVSAKTTSKILKNDPKLIENRAQIGQNLFNNTGVSTIRLFWFIYVGLSTIYGRRAYVNTPEIMAPLLLTTTATFTDGNFRIDTDSVGTGHISLNCKKC